jgi:hypothetical protein
VKAKDGGRVFGCDNDDNVYNGWYLQYTIIMSKDNVKKTMNMCNSVLYKNTNITLCIYSGRCGVLNNIHKPYKNLAMDITGGGRVEAVDYRSTSTIFVQYYLCYRVFRNKD